MMKTSKNLALLALFMVACLLALTGNLQAAVPAAVDDAIEDVTTVGAAVFTAMIAIGLPIMAWKLVKRVRGS